MPSQTKPNIYFFFQTQTTLRNRNQLKDFIRDIFRREGRTLESLNYIFCDDQQLLEINRQYLNHDYFTDIISFELSQKNEPVVGEIYISIDRVRDNALQLGETYTKELHRVIFHGALHLCGYKDKKPRETTEMRKAESKYLGLYFRSR